MSSAADKPIRYRRLRAPSEYGAALIDPPVPEAVKLVAANRALAASWDQSSGLSFAKWREHERRQTIHFAAMFHEGTRLSEQFVEKLAKQPLILSGHQPGFFHPGVWLKSFLVDRIAKDLGGSGINLLICSDAMRMAGIRVPTGRVASPRIVEVPFDIPAEEIPFEERLLIDRQLFGSFAERVRDAIDPLLAKDGSRPRLLVERLWEHVPEVLRFGSRLQLGQCVAIVRNRVERELGLATRDYPFLGSGWPYWHFVVALLERWSEYHPIYNAALAEFRAVNQIRNRHQPAPDLAKDDDWLEAPFWIWSKEDPHRRRAFIRPTPRGWEISDRAAAKIFSEDGSIDWHHSEHQLGIKLRPRAFITTMYARLVLSDLFIHGIGGAKYDELTDALIRRFFGIEPPAYVTATATFRLPIDRPQVTEVDVRAIERRIRDTMHHPESFTDDVEGSARRELMQLAGDKRELIAARWQDKQKKVWHDRVTNCNERMTALLASVRERLLAQRQKLLADLHASSLLGSREFSFVLFPEETLPRALLDLCAGNA